MKEGYAAVFNGPGKKMAVKKYPVTAPGTGQVLLRMVRSGICGTDVHIYKGKLAMPPGDLILGHELIGTVQTAGSGALKDGLGKRIRQGDRVIACVALPCGTCFNCKKGETASCLNFGVTYVQDPEAAPHFHGGFAEYLYSPAGNVVKIPPGVDVDAVAAFPCAGPTVLRSLEYAGPLKKNELVVVQGTGPMGLFAVARAAAAGCTVVAIGSGRQPERMDLAEKLGASFVLDYRKMTAEKRLAKIQKLAADLNRGNGADVVIEASGAPSAVPEGLDLVRTRGRYVIPGQYSSSGGVQISPEVITFKAIRITGSGQYTLADIGTYLSFIKKYPQVARIFARTVTHKYPVKDIDRAMADAVSGKSIKGVLAA